MLEVPMSKIPSYYATRTGNSAAVIYGDKTISWADLDARSSRRANWLRAAGVRQGDFVLISLRNEPEFFESTFATWKVGATPVPVAVNTPPGQLTEIMEIIRPAAIISHADFIACDRPKLLCAEDLSGFEESFDCSDPAPNWKAIMSGGSTGKPKIIVDRRPAVFDVDAPAMLQKSCGCVLNPGPLYHNAPFLSSHNALFAGSTVVNMSRFDAVETLRLIEKYRVDWVNFVPTMMHRIWRLPTEVRAQYDLSSLEVVFHMASAMPAWLKEAWMDWIGPSKIWELYAGTEGFGATMIDGLEWRAHPGSVGRPLPACELKIVAPDGQECAVGETGEVYFRATGGANKTYHYLGSADAPSGDGGWESYGDLGRVDRDGFLFLADRKTDLIIRGGANIYPAEIETALDEHEHVRSSLVIGLPDEDLGETVHAIVHADDLISQDELITDLLDHLRERVAPNKLPESFEFSGEAVRDDAGKARRSAVRKDRIDWLSAGNQAWRLGRARGAGGVSP